MLARYAINGDAGSAILIGRQGVVGASVLPQRAAGIGSRGGKKTSSTTEDLGSDKRQKMEERARRQPAERFIVERVPR